jgi:hypothetical protein
MLDQPRSHSAARVNLSVFLVLLVPLTLFLALSSGGASIYALALGCFGQSHIGRTVLTGPTTLTQRHMRRFEVALAAIVASAGATIALEGLDLATGLYLAFTLIAALSATSAAMGMEVDGH